MSALRFNIIFEDAGEGSLYARVHELPEVDAQGEGRDHPRQMVHEAIRPKIEDRRERGKEIPATGWRLWSPSRSVREARPGATRGAS
jgi:predicted RNase H-like HicB family nuclease